MNGFCDSCDVDATVASLAGDGADLRIAALYFSVAVTVAVSVAITMSVVN